jgi:tryptophanyl-tRNA synthetase
LRKTYQETGDIEALNKAQALLKEQQNITLGDRERLLGYTLVSISILVSRKEMVLP